MQENILKLSELSTYKIWKGDNAFHIVDQSKVFKGTVVNRALPFLHGGSLEITLTVPLM